MDLSKITPLIITWNEDPNIDRCLSRLKWASRIVIIDSGSTDETLKVCSTYPQVQIIHRKFDSFAEQCNFGLLQISTEWVLSMDADYLLPTSFSDVLAALPSTPSGYSARFRYCIFGRPLRASLYPARTVLYQKSAAQYQNVGHGHRVAIEGPVGDLPCRIEHDDRKPLGRWLDSQRKYARQEAQHLALADSRTLPFADRVRRRIWPAVPAVFVYVLIWKRCLLDGWAGWFYALQRTYAELLLSLELVDLKLRNTKDRQNGTT